MEELDYSEDSVEDLIHDLNNCDGSIYSGDILEELNRRGIDAAKLEEDYHKRILKHLAHPRGLLCEESFNYIASKKPNDVKDILTTKVQLHLDYLTANLKNYLFGHFITCFYTVNNTRKFAILKRNSNIGSIDYDFDEAVEYLLKNGQFYL